MDADKRLFAGVYSRRLVFISGHLVGRVKARCGSTFEYEYRFAEYEYKVPNSDRTRTQA